MDMIFCRGMRFVSAFEYKPILVKKNFLETARLMRCSESKRAFKLLENYPHYRNLSSNYTSFFNHIRADEILLKQKFYNNILEARYCNSNATKGEVSGEPTKNLSRLARLKKLTKEYWYLVIPIHVATSLCWVGLIYTAIDVGLDFGKLLELLHFSQKYIDMIRNSTAGNWALVYLLYKVFTPFRYTATVGFTTWAIRRFSKSGLIKPMTYGKSPQVVHKTTEPGKATSQKGFKVDQQTYPPKT